MNSYETETIKDLFNKSKSTRPLILDGSSGMYLQQKYPEWYDQDIWLTRVNTEKPEEIKHLAKSYIDAGAEIITTNTFRTTPYRFHCYNKRNPNNLKDPENEVRDVMKIYTDLKKQTNNKFLIAGSNACVEKCYTRERFIKDEIIRDSHENHINYLHKYGADIILNEALQHNFEIEVSAKYCFNNNLDFITSLYFDDDLKLMSGESVLDTMKMLDQFNPLAIAVNCVSYSRLKKLITEGSEVIKNLKSGFGYYLNCGNPDTYESKYIDGNFDLKVTPDDYVKIAKEFDFIKPTFVGHCCMSGPEHTRSLANFYKK
jgi:S-methylmethionine-dependent homocysteine/selenocysteine methylase